MSFAAVLRTELSDRAENYARIKALPFSLSYGRTSTVCFAPYEDDSLHGNFLPASYKAILANPGWRRRLAKVHAQARRSLPATERGRWMELDSCNSSDALLMNLFCHPAVARSAEVGVLLGSEPGSARVFCYRARVPLQLGRFDRTEVDLLWGNVLIEAKLTEHDFQTAGKEKLLAYRDFTEVFDAGDLPQSENSYFSYQLLRNVLAAYAQQRSFCVLVDVRRPDLIDAWYAVMKCVKPLDLRTRLRIATWQELARHTPPNVRDFLETKYGITA